MTLLFQYGPIVLVALTSALVAYLIAPGMIRFFQSRSGSVQPERGSLLADRLFLLVAGAALIGLPAQVVHSYNAFGSYPDFAYFDASVLDMLRGVPIMSIGAFARRFNPILTALVPLYSLWPDPRILLVLESVGLAITAFPLYWLARKRIGHWPALIIIIAFLASESIETLNYATFYEIKLAVPTLTFASYFLLQKRDVPFLVCLGISLLIKQEIALVAVGFALFIFFVQGRRWLGLALAVSGAGLALFVVLVLYPSFTNNLVYPQFDERYAYLGHTLQEVVFSLILRPDLVLQHVVTISKMKFVLSLFVPLALLPLLGIEVTAISFPVWAYTLLSDLSQQFDPGQYYQAPLIPFLFLGTVVGLERLLSWGSSLGFRSHDRSLGWKWALLVLLFTSSQLYLPAAWTRILDPSSFMLSRHDLIGHQLLARFPADVNIYAQAELFMPLYAKHLASVYEFSPNGDYRGASYLFGDSTRAWYSYQKEAWEHWRASGYFETVAEEDGYFLLGPRSLPQSPARLDNGWTVYKSASNPSRVMVDNGWALIGYTDAPSTFLKPLSLGVGDDLTLLGFVSVPGGNISGGGTLNAIAEWRANQDIHGRYTILVQLVDGQGHIWAQENREPIIPTDGWKTGDIIRDQYTLLLPRTMPPGNYRVQVGVWNPQIKNSLEVRDTQGASQGNRAVVAQLQVEKDSGNIPADFLMVENAFRVDMHELRFLGSTSIPLAAAAGDELQVGLYWRARAKPRGDYSVSIQLRDASGRVALEQRDRPAAGAYPTPRWQLGEVLLDWHDMTVPADLPAGDYTLTVVLWDMADLTVLGEAKIGQVKIGD